MIKKKVQIVMIGVMLMIKRLCIVGVMLCILLSGCGNAAKTGTSKETKVGGNTEKVLAQGVEKLEEDKVDEALIEEYPEWFDRKGNIVYPYTPDKPKKWKKAWKKAGSYVGLTEMLQIPEELTDVLSTKRLLKAVEEYPLLDITRYNNTKEALEDFSKIFYGMKALLEREDCGRAAFESYCSRNIKPTKKYNAAKNYSKDSDLLNQLVLEEYLIAQETTYEVLSEEERILMIKTYTKNKEKKEKLKGFSEMLLYHYGFEAVVSEESNPWNTLLNSGTD